MTKEEAKKFVIDTILTGDSKMIARVVKRYQEVYGKSRPNGEKTDLPAQEHMDMAKVAEKIFSEKTESQSV